MRNDFKGKEDTYLRLVQIAIKLLKSTFKKIFIVLNIWIHKYNDLDA